MTAPKKKTPKLKQAENTRKDASPLNGVVPPVDKRWKAGAPSPNPHGRPRKLKDLQELILATLAEEVGGNTTRAELLIRTMLIKSPSDRVALLEYAFGKVTQPYANVDWREEARKQGIDPDAISKELVDQFSAAMVGASAGGSVADRQGEEGAIDSAPPPVDNG